MIDSQSHMVDPAVRAIVHGRRDPVDRSLLEEDDANSQLLIAREVESGNQLPGTRLSHNRKPWRLRWPDEFRDEVLARLLERNEQRHNEELLTGAMTLKRSEVDGKKSKTKNTAAKSSRGQQKLFQESAED